jgi:lactate dehydrogenase-like 2-hydroxyacid dehydrogenase
MSIPKIVVLQTNDLPEAAVEALGRQFDVRRIPEEGAAREQFLEAYGTSVRAIAGTGKGRVDAQLLARLPSLEIISVSSAGLDAIDTDAVAARSIPIYNTSTILADDVADLALWLILGTTRSLAQADRFVRNREWRKDNYYPLGKTIHGMKIGVLGLGHIGKAIARRLEISGAELGYTGRTRQSVVGYTFFADLVDLAQWSDLLVVSCPATAATYHLVNAEVLRALGPNGILVNIARGNIIDETALIDALEKGEIFGAGLDVFEYEPEVPQALIDSKRTILLPHIGSATHGTRTRMWENMVAVLEQHFELAERG